MVLGIFVVILLFSSVKQTDGQYGNPPSSKELNYGNPPISKETNYQVDKQVGYQIQETTLQNPGYGKQNNQQQTAAQHGLKAFKYTKPAAEYQAYRPVPDKSNNIIQQKSKYDSSEQQQPPQQQQQGNPYSNPITQEPPNPGTVYPPAQPNRESSEEGNNNYKNNGASPPGQEPPPQTSTANKFYFTTANSKMNHLYFTTTTASPPHLYFTTSTEKPRHLYFTTSTSNTGYPTVPYGAVSTPADTPTNGYQGYNKASSDNPPPNYPAKPQTNPERYPPVAYNGNPQPTFQQPPYLTTTVNPYGNNIKLAPLVDSFQQQGQQPPYAFSNYYNTPENPTQILPYSPLNGGGGGGVDQKSTPFLPALGYPFYGDGKFWYFKVPVDQLQRSAPSTVSPQNEIYAKNERKRRRQRFI